jgi:hypothetical protein
VPDIGINAMDVTKSAVGTGDVLGVLRYLRLTATAKGSFFSAHGLRQMLAKYYFENPTHTTLPLSSRTFVSVWSRSGRRIRKLLPQLLVCF